MLLPARRRNGALQFGLSGLMCLAIVVRGRVGRSGRVCAGLCLRGRRLLPAVVLRALTGVRRIGLLG